MCEWGVLHEFSSISGVREDVSDLILNIKGIAVSLDAGALASASAGRRPIGRNIVISGSAGVEIMNPDRILCHLDKGASLSMEMTVESGKVMSPQLQTAQKMLNRFDYGR